ncbi:hypothetical protein SADUNF_Sadunf15G0098100 [Salix dunnii]|uniref:Mediator of RNA polymerase II transcription subunit 31 n=1 Tax=Salix dunnii TaxID=1413687 RepID=A0A835JEY3_9ROSI|nr:hypothetical protein SADUNF_Sadunf15G0098100 [Salix dunnii]
MDADVDMSSRAEEDEYQEPNSKRRLKEIEEEAGALREMQAKVEKEMGAILQVLQRLKLKRRRWMHDPFMLVDYSCTPEEVQQHFQSCGTVNRVTILTDKFGQPKGFAYVEFIEVDAVQNALILNESELHGRQLKVSAKRTNVPGMKQFRGRRASPYGFRSQRAFMPAPFYSPYGYGSKVQETYAVQAILGNTYSVAKTSMASFEEAENNPETPSSPKKIYKDPDDGRQRFLLELEFVQCLANPTYIHYLAQNRYFEDEAFIGYLKYLLYWQRPEYMKFIMYPHCLYFLELLQNANFRNAMAHPANKELAHRQQFFFWKNYRNNRLKHILPRPLPEPAAAPPAPAPVPPVPAATLGMLATSGAVPSPMPYGMPPGSAFGKSDIRSSGSERRKRKKEA